MLRASCISQGIGRTNAAICVLGREKWEPLGLICPCSFIGIYLHSEDSGFLSDAGLSTYSAFTNFISTCCTQILKPEL